MSNDFPQELEKACRGFESAMRDVEKCLHPFLTQDGIKQAQNFETRGAIKFDLAALYAINSLYWSFLVMSGINPKNHLIKQELSRIQTYMERWEDVYRK